MLFHVARRQSGQKHHRPAPRTPESGRSHHPKRWLLCALRPAIYPQVDHAGNINKGRWAKNSGSCRGIFGWTETRRFFLRRRPRPWSTKRCKLAMLVWRTSGDVFLPVRARSLDIKRPGCPPHWASCKTTHNAKSFKRVPCSQTANPGS